MAFASIYAFLFAMALQLGSKNQIDYYLKAPLYTIQFLLYYIRKPLDPFVERLLLKKQKNIFDEARH
jgi:hypothetical protein